MCTVLLAGWLPCHRNGCLRSPGLALVMELGGEGWGPAGRVSPVAVGGPVGLHHVLKYPLIVNKSIIMTFSRY